MAFIRYFCVMLFWLGQSHSIIDGALSNLNKQKQKKAAIYSNISLLSCCVCVLFVFISEFREFSYLYCVRIRLVDFFLHPNRRLRWLWNVKGKFSMRIRCIWSYLICKNDKSIKYTVRPERHHIIIKRCSHFSAAMLRHLCLSWFMLIM